MTTSHKKSWLAIIVAALPLGALAGDLGTAFTQVGTNGVGVGYATSVGEDWAVRGVLSSYNQAFTGDIGDFGPGSNLNVKLDLSSAQIVADWYPMGDGFRVSGGAVFNNNKISISGVGQVDGVATTVNAEVKMSDGVSPYLGVGYSSKPKYAKGFGLTFDLGVMFQNPKATIAQQANLTATNVANETAELQNAMNKLKNMPVFAIGISYSF